MASVVAGGGRIVVALLGAFGGLLAWTGPFKVLPRGGREWLENEIWLGLPVSLLCWIAAAAVGSALGVRIFREPSANADGQ